MIENINSDKDIDFLRKPIICKTKKADCFEQVVLKQSASKLIYKTLFFYIFRFDSIFGIFIFFLMSKNRSFIISENTRQQII